VKHALIVLCSVLFAASLPGPDFRNIAQRAGLTAIFPNGGAQTKKYIIETTGSGVGFIDYDNDNLLDIFVVSGEGGTNRMYRNEGHDRFTDVTKQLNLISEGWGQGVCAGDYDNDGFTDIFVTYWGANRLYRNIEGKRFQLVSQKAGLTQDRVRYNTGCAFLDYDRDGHLDLFVANYLKFDYASTPKPGANPFCYYRNLPVACGPRGLPFERNLLYHNNGDGTFTDVSENSGIAKPAGHYGLGVLTGDFNNDGFPDIYVACDRTPSLLYINLGDGTFSEEGLLRGAALDDDGKSLSGMGAASADFDGDGHPDIFRTNFSDERETLYRNRGSGEFDDVTRPAGIAHNTRYVGWGCGFLDFDNDGYSDLLLVNGHVFPEVDRLKENVRYKNSAILYRNDRNGKFEDLSDRGGAGIVELHSSRGAAFGDIDNDGSIEVLINNQNEPPSLLQMTQTPAGHWLILSLRGRRSNRSAIGAKVRITAGDRTQASEVRSGGSYLSQSDLRLHFGLGAATHVDSIEILWPDGSLQRKESVPVDRVISVTQSSETTR
jgi:hypothetical protein